MRRCVQEDEIFDVLKACHNELCGGEFAEKRTAYKVLRTREWDEKLLEALWAYRITWRNGTGHNLYELVYGKQGLLPIEFKVKTFQIANQLGMNLNEAQEQRLMQLNELDEIRHDAFHRTMLVQDQRARWHDKFIKKKIFHSGDWALLYDSKFKQRKLSTRWLGPYEVDEVFDNGLVHIKTIDGSQTSFVVNGYQIKIYHQPLSRQQFL
eukprot:PITA_26650